jgi:glucose uptake protein GlcU
MCATSASICGTNLTCSDSVCVAPTNSNCTSAQGCQSGVCSGSVSGSTCVNGTAQVGALCVTSTSGCNCLSGVCGAFAVDTTIVDVPIFSTWAIVVTSILGALLLVMIVIAINLKKKVNDAEGRASGIVY